MSAYLGERKRMTFRIPLYLVDRLETEAVTTGAPVNEVLVRILERQRLQTGRDFLKIASRKAIGER